MNPQDPTVPQPGGAPPAEDAGSQALAEALRSSFFIVQIIMVALVLVFIGSGFFTVLPQEKAVILRLGKPVDGGRLFEPGPHWAWPAPIDEVVKLHITSLTNADSTVGWYQTAQERAKRVPKPGPMSSLNPANITYTLSADTNIIHVMATAHYRVTDLMGFYFNFTNAAVFITNALNNSLVLASSEFPVDDILTGKRVAFRERVYQRTRELIDSEHLGVTVDQVDVDISPPLALERKFSEVDQAMLKRDSMLNEAQTYATTNVAKARGEADTRVKVADAIREKKVKILEAQAKTFTNLLAQYERDPVLFKRVLQMMALETVYTNAQEKILLPPNSKEYRFQFNREPQEPPPLSIPNHP
jgi:membrane protease subunit HflK